MPETARLDEGCKIAMTSKKRLRGPIIAAGALLAAIIALTTTYDGWRLHQQLMAANEREVGNLALALATGTARSVQAVDVVLRDTAAWYEATGRLRMTRRSSDALASRAVGVSQVSVITIVDRSGMQRYRSRATGEPLSDVSDRGYFLRQRDEPDAGLVINEPVVSRSERMPSLILSRPLRRPDGSFDGVVSAILTLQELQSMYAAIRLGDHGSPAAGARGRDDRDPPAAHATRSRPLACRSLAAPAERSLGRPRGEPHRWPGETGGGAARRWQAARPRGQSRRARRTDTLVRRDDQRGHPGGDVDAARSPRHRRRPSPAQADRGRRAGPAREPGAICNGHGGRQRGPHRVEPASGNGLRVRQMAVPARTGRSSSDRHDRGHQALGSASRRRPAGGVLGHRPASRGR